MGPCKLYLVMLYVFGTQTGSKWVQYKTHMKVISQEQTSNFHRGWVVRYQGCIKKGLDKSNAIKC